MFPLTGLRLLLPALVPSWRFFDAVTASPRVDYVVLGPFEDGPDEADPAWQEFRPRPEVVTVATMLRRLLWNPQWNESLFLVSLSERLIHAATGETALHSQRELLLRVARDLHRMGLASPDAFLQIRLRLVGREGERVDSAVVYLSAPCAMEALLTP